MFGLRQKCNFPISCRTSVSAKTLLQHLFQDSGSFYLLYDTVSKDDSAVISFVAAESQHHTHGQRGMKAIQHYCCFDFIFFVNSYWLFHVPQHVTVIFNYWLKKIKHHTTAASHQPANARQRRQFPWPTTFAVLYDGKMVIFSISFIFNFLRGSNRWTRRSSCSDKEPQATGSTPPAPSEGANFNVHCCVEDDLDSVWC